MDTVSTRPRELRWYHAAGLLFGDWGTSRLYVLGLAFALSGHASFWYVTAMCGLVTLVGICYMVVCKHFPDGGGVYSAAKQRSRDLAVVGALLLFADYIVTAALSAYEGFRYLLPVNVDTHWALTLAIIAVIAIGAMNFFGLRRPGWLALVVALGCFIMYLILGIFCVSKAQGPVIIAPQGGLGQIWDHFANVILALSGVETIANMTGVMSSPVAKNARRAISIVLVEVVVLNIAMAWAMNALPQLANYSPADQRDHMLKILAIEYVAPWFAAVASVFFGVLLLSATNTAIGGMVSIQYLMSRDGEMPGIFTRLNRYGMPWVALIAATVVTALVLLVVGDATETLASLYTIGVVGAITINLLSTGTNRELGLNWLEKGALVSVGVLMGLIELTIAYSKIHALIFALLVVGGGLALRWGFNFVRARVKPVPVPVEAAPFGAPTPAVRAAFASNMSRVLVATRGSPKLMNFASTYARDRNAALFVLFVREVALPFHERSSDLGTETMNLQRDKEAQAFFETAGKVCEGVGVPMVPLYAVHDSPAELILDNAATLGVDTLIMGASRRGPIWKVLHGDVLEEVIQYLPERIPLLIYA